LTGQEAVLVPGGRGIFQVRVDGKVVSEKTHEGFPGPDEVAGAVQHALGT
jgi:predicted Rdx family selenoprotein